MALDRKRDTLDFEFQDQVRAGVEQAVSSYQAIEPGVRVEVQIYSDSTLESALRRRNRSGLGPDLLMLWDTLAIELHQKGLIQSVDLPTAVTEQLIPTTVRKLRLHDGRLIGLPFGFYPQLACFDRRRIAKSPGTLQELITASAGGLRVGMAIDLVHLGWSMGGLGLVDDLQSIGRGHGVSPENREAISRWLDWLSNAGNLHRFTFFSSAVEPIQLLTEGKLDWVPCRSHQVNRIQKRMGEHLGVARLPAGEEGPASPSITTMVLSFGTNSSRRQHRAAKAFAAFAINPQRQRNATLRTLTVLPVNRTVKVPTESSSFLEAMQQSRDDALTYSQDDSLISATAPDQATVNKALVRMDGVLTRFLLGDLDRRGATDAVISVLQGGSGR